MTEKLTDTDFGEKTKTGNWIVDFWAPWCGPCILMGPIIDEIATELGGKANVGKLNVDENKMTASKFGVMSIPTLIFFKDGAEVDKLVGSLPKEKIIEKANEVFGLGAAETPGEEHGTEKTEEEGATA